MPDTDLVRLARGLWVTPEQSANLAGRCAALLDRSADGSAIVGVTAARVHQLWLPDVRDVIEVASISATTAARALTRTRRPQFVAHRRQLAEGDITVVDGVLVTTLARTWVDLAVRLSLPDLVAAGDCALRSGASIEELDDVIARSRRARGVRRAREARALLDPRSRSRPESHLRVAVVLGDLPPFEVNEPVHRATGGWLAEPDLSLAEAKLALEYQGSDHADVDRRRKDITRATDLRSEGWACIEYGPAQVFGRPWQIAPELRALIRVRAPHLLRAG